MTKDLKVMYLQLNNIQTFYYDKVSKDTANQRLSLINHADYLRYSLVVEHVGFQHYVLIEGYNEFSALKALDRSIKVFCNVIAPTDEKTQLLRILRKVIPFERASWRFNHYHIKILQEKYQMTSQDISREIWQKRRKVEEYIYRKDIPMNIIALAEKNNASMTLVNDIAKSQTILPAAKEVLFNLAVLPKDHAFRLKTRSFEHVKLLFGKLSNYENIFSDSKLVRSLTYHALNSDNHLLSSWQQILDANNHLLKKPNSIVQPPQDNNYDYG
ncbi:hypothetical protein BpOF4_06475 [Alkalihalophilus pseudofirmus OF4]|uniref:Uncharacterized protein n=1 Tax=Alkalihalophilus pseudofirmus (strain ATCC BAA-2126 / JCM 17055 / OF4) TaxID=398511 RepID=D3G078_ALKPO|nr:hypothetical protein [Alkalihalophilus pseudofirmus]ADC49353.1 hypothetical protein BpOF4_06475 [Alkalihalophilus pseudofirmus OF4]